MGASILRVTDPSANGIDFNNNDYLTACGGVADLSIEAGPGFQTSGSFVAGSSGIGVRAAHMNNGWGLHNVDVSGFGTGIAYLGSWNTTSTNVHVRFFSGDGILIDKGPDGNTSGGNKIVGGTVSNNGYASPNGSVGLRMRASGGDFFSKIDMTGLGLGVVVDPRVGDQVAYAFFETILADTSVGDGWVFDGSGGNIYAARGTDVWGSYGGGNGLVTIGPNLHGLRLKGVGLRENALRGWDHRGGDGIELVTPEIHSNGRGSTAGTYPGVQIASGLTAQKNFAILGGSIGNAESSSTTQGEAIKFLGSAANFRVEGVDMNGTGGGKSVVGFPDETQLTSFKMLGNLPAASYGVNPSERVAQSGGGYVASGVTAYFEPSGPVPSPNTAPAFAARTSLVGKAYMAVNTAPGAGQTFTYRLVVNGTPTGATGSISGASSYAVTFYPGSCSTRVTATSFRSSDRPAPRPPCIEDSRSWSLDASWRAARPPRFGAAFLNNRRNTGRRQQLSWLERLHDRRQRRGRDPIRLVISRAHNS